MRVASRGPTCPPWAVLGAVFLIFMMAGLIQGHYNRFRTTPETPWPWPDSWLSNDQRNDAVAQHPITTLMTDAKHTFSNKLARQSKTLAEAVAEYKRRYERDPPRGFDDWYAFAKENGFVLVDEFDTIVEDLAPFWALSGEELRKRAYQMGYLPSIDLVRVEDGNVSTVNIKKAYVDRELGLRSWGMRNLMERFKHKLPNMDFPVNAIAEGRVLIPWEHITYPNLTEPDGHIATLLDDFTADWKGKGSVWDAFRRTCPPDSPARRLYSSYRNPNIQKRGSLMDRSSSAGNDPSPFSQGVPESVDFCGNPSAHYMQGHFFSDWRTVPILFPVFTPAKAEGYSDIRIPSHYYFKGHSRYTYAWDRETESVKDVDDMEVPWDQKSDLVFWRGATTGGGSTPPGHSPTYQRHRFLRMAHEGSKDNMTIVHASPSQPDTFTSTTVRAKDLNRDIMDVAFIRALGSYPGGETELRKHHRFAPTVPLGKHWAYKYLIDLDGMSYSGRFMALMDSDSVVLKSTVYKEFWSDWVQPWLHYIPLSASYSEIYNIHAYFSGPSPSTVGNVTGERQEAWDAVKKERDGELRRIARAGKQWRHTIARKTDMEVYVYRLCLEYARLWADDRDAMGFVL